MRFGRELNKSEVGKRLVRDKFKVGKSQVWDKYEASIRQVLDKYEVAGVLVWEFLEANIEKRNR